MDEGTRGEENDKESKKITMEEKLQVVSLTRESCSFLRSTSNI